MGCPNQLFWNCLWTLVTRISDLTDFRSTNRQSQNFSNRLSANKISKIFEKEILKKLTAKLNLVVLIRVGYLTSKTSNHSKVLIKCVHLSPRFKNIQRKKFQNFGKYFKNIIFKKFWNLWLDSRKEIGMKGFQNGTLNSHPDWLGSRANQSLNLDWPIRTYPWFHIIDFGNQRFMSFQSSFSFRWIRWVLD